MKKPLYACINSPNDSLKKYQNGNVYMYTYDKNVVDNKR